MQQKYLYLFFFLLCFGSTAFAQTPAQIFDYGKLQNNEYSNNFFKLSVKLPETWYVNSEQQQKEIMNLGKAMFAGEDKTLKNMVEASKVNSATLLMAFQYEVGAPVDYNPGVVIIAENLKNSPGVKSGNDYLFHLKRTMAASEAKFVIDKEVYNTKIGNQDFAVLEVKLVLPIGAVNQKYYVTVKNNYCLGFITTYLTEENKNEVDKVINTIAFK